MKKYIVIEGKNSFESNSRNVRKHINDGGCSKVTVLDAKSKKFVCEGIKQADGHISIRTKADEFGR